MSAQPTYQKSVEEELELTSRGGVVSNESRTVGRGEGVAPKAVGTNSETNNKGFTRNLKTNNFFLPPSLKWMKSNKTAASNSLATSPVIFGRNVTRPASYLDSFFNNLLMKKFNEFLPNRSFCQIDPH